MPKTLTFEYRYPVDPDRLFALISDLDTLEAVSRPFMQFHHLPSGPVRSGQVIDVAISVFGLLPARPYRIRVIECAPDQRRLQSQGDGMGVACLTHAVQVKIDGTGEPGGARLLEQVKVDAGWRTPFVAICARVLSRRRHLVRLRLLGLTRG